MAEIAPVNVIDRRTLVIHFFGDFGEFALLNVLGNLQAVILNALRPDVRLIPRPCHTATAEEPILDAVFHRCAKVRVMLNLKVDGPLKELRGHAAHLVVVAKAAGDVSFWKFGVDGGDQRLDV